jgi:hypothetical protein
MPVRSARLFVVFAGLLGLGLLGGCETPQSPPATAAVAAPVLPAYLRQDLYPAWVDAAGNIKWPPNNGFAATPTPATLPPGELIDRFGSENGTFFSPKGESFDARSLPYVCTRMAYTVYRVTQAIHVQEGKAAPWFGEPGGAEQYETDQPASKLRESGALQAMPGDGSGTGKPAAPCGGS